MVSMRCLEHAPESNRHDISGAWNWHLPIMAIDPILLHEVRLDVGVVSLLSTIDSRTNDAGAIYDTLAHELYALKNVLLQQW
jgi:hypothetical protein